MFGLGHWELIGIAVIILIIFGPKNLPKIGQSLGKGIREFKDATQGITKELEDVGKEEPGNNSNSTDSRSQDEIIKEQVQERRS